MNTKNESASYQPDHRNIRTIYPKTNNETILEFNFDKV